MKRIIGLFAILLLLPLFSSLASNPQVDKHPLMRFLKKEKVKVRTENVIEQMQTHTLEEIKQKMAKAKQSDVILSESIDGIVMLSNVPESEMHAAINPTDSNNIVVSPINQNMNNQFLPITCPVYYTKDFGQTWQKSSFTTSTPVDLAWVIGGGDPVFAYDTDGRLYLSWIYLYIDFTAQSTNAGMFYAISEDGGETFVFDDESIIGEIANLASEENEAPFLDKQWMASDLGDTPFTGSIYLSATAISMGDSEEEVEARIHVYRKEAGKRYFEKEPFIIEGDFPLVQFSSIDVDNIGYVHVTFFGMRDLVWDPELNEYTGGDLGLYHTVSKDGGKTFSLPNLITNFVGSFEVTEGDKIQIEGVSLDRLYPSPYLAIDKSGVMTNNMLYLTFTATGLSAEEQNSHHNIYLTRSEDSGTTWETPWIINSDFYDGIENHNYYSNIYVNPEGKVLVGWYDRRHSTGAMSHYYLGISEDAGTTFERQFPVTSQDTDFSTVGLMNAEFGIGEYNQMVATHTHAFVFWADGRTRDGNMNVYVAKVDLNKEVSVEEAKPMAARFTLNDAYPNPSKGNFTIDFDLDVSSDISISVFDVNGKEVFSQDLGIYSLGNHKFNVNLSNSLSGTYFYKLQTNYGYAVKRLTLEK